MAWDTDTMQDRSTYRGDELELLSAVLAGDPKAMTRFVERYRGIVELGVRQVLRRAASVASAEDVEDLVHEIWVSLFEEDRRRLRRFDPTREVRVATWIGLLSRNKTVDRLRGAGARDRFVRLTDDGVRLPERASGLPTPSEVVEGRERQRVAQEALDRLRDDERRFLEAWYLDDRDPEALAADLGVAVGTVYTRRFKLQQKLAKHVHHLIRSPRRKVSGMAALVPCHAA
ncbi:MAG: sigma-70 family RNA polymerase sigma factor [Deltaproteobacteria bacterium]|nr:sigma-70 family RNA polymerase sigma factor [Deltaproteobacteria bacterium]